MLIVATGREKGFPFHPVGSIRNFEIEIFALEVYNALNEVNNERSEESSLRSVNRLFARSFDGVRREFPGCPQGPAPGQGPPATIPYAVLRVRASASDSRYMARRLQGNHARVERNHAQPYSGPLLIGRRTRLVREASPIGSFKTPPSDVPIAPVAQ